MFDWAGAFVLVAVSAGVWRAAQRLRSWSSVVASLPETRVADLAEGKQVKVTGVVESTATIAAPLTGRPCVGWCVRELSAGGLDRVTRYGAGDFWLVDDDGGRVLVHGTRAALVMTTADGISAGRSEQGRVERESLVVAGDRVSVVAMVRRELDASQVSLYREPPTRLALDGIPLWIVAAG